MESSISMNTQLNVDASDAKRLLLELSQSSWWSQRQLRINIFAFSVQFFGESLDCQATSGHFIYLKLNNHECRTGSPAVEILETVSRDLRFKILGPFLG